jgi:hypothetical protein
MDIMWLVMAPSSGGKSTFIKTHRAFEITGLTPGQRLQADQYRQGARLSGSFYLHGCMNRNNIKPFFDLLAEDPIAKRAIILAVPQTRHKLRVLKRTREARAGLAPATYPRILLNLPFDQYLLVYDRSLEQLRKHGIDYQILHADQPGYPLIDEADLLQVLGAYDKGRNSSTYQEIWLP